MTRLHFQLVAAFLIAATPVATADAQRAASLAAGVTRPVAPRVGSFATTSTAVPVASEQDRKVVKGALIGAGLGAAIGVWVVTAGRSTGSGPDHAADSDPKIILIPACAVVGGLLGVIAASRL